MPRKFPRSVVSSYQLEDDTKKPADSVTLGSEMAEGDDSGYDPNAFYLRATDRHGHCKNIQVTIPTTFGPVIQQIIDSPTNPYRSAVDLARDGLVHIIARRLKQIQTEQYVEWDWLRPEQIEQIRFETEQKIRDLDTIEETCQVLVTAEDWHQLQQVLYAAANQPLPKGLRLRRDELVSRYTARIPQGYHYSYDLQ